MRADVLSSNYDLLNAGLSASRSLFGSRNANGTSGSSSNTNTTNARTRRQPTTIAFRTGRTRSDSRTVSLKENGAAESSSSASNKQASSMKAVPRVLKASRAATNGSANGKLSSEPSVDSPSGGKKRKRRPAPAPIQPIPNTRSSSGTSTRSSMRHRGGAPVSQASVDSATFSRSDSESSLSSRTSSYTSKSSLSLRRDLDNMFIHSQSPESSPTSRRARTGRGHAASASASSSNLRRRSSRVQHESDGQEMSDDEEPAEIDRRDQLLTEAPVSQLDRHRKAALARLAQEAGISITPSMTKSAIIEAIVEYRSAMHGSASSSSSTALTRKPGSVIRSDSADYTDESDEEQGHEAGGEETEAETGSVKGLNGRTRRPLRTKKALGVVNATASAAAAAATRAANGRHLTLPARSDDVTAAASSPMVNRLRKQKSIHFASSPARIRGRGKKAADHHSPLKPLPKRKMPRHLTAVETDHGKVEGADEDRMDEDWVDDMPPAKVARRTQRRPQRKAKAQAKQHLTEASDDEMEVDTSYRRSTAGDKAASPVAATDDEDAESEVVDTQGEEGDAEEEGDEDDDDDTATQIGVAASDEDQDDTYIDSDSTDTPDGRAVRIASPSSPAKMRRLRNGKLRILKPAVAEVQDTDIEVESQLTMAPPTAKPQKRGQANGRLREVSRASSSSGSSDRTSRGSSTNKKKDADPSLKAKVATPQLESENEDAKSADAEHVDELNGLDLESLNLTDKEIPSKQLSKTSKIGSGGFKDVYVGIWRVGKRRNKVAIADIREKLTEMDIKELGLLRDLKHENIVRFIGVSIPDDTARTGIPCMIVSELCSNGDLWDYVRNVKPPSNLDIFRMLLETARGLEYLHMHSIVHRDVKSSNVLVTRSRSCKINDFGLARVKKSQRSKMHSVVGTVNWQAVELWCAAPQYNEKVDVWSAAMTFWETLQWHEEYKAYPFEGMNEFMIYEEVGKKGMRPNTDKIAGLFGEEIVRLLHKMWDTDPRKRPTMDMVCRELEHLIETKKLEAGI